MVDGPHGRGGREVLDAIPSTHILSRREFVTRSALIAGVGALAPFTFVRDARAQDAELRAYLHRMLRVVKTPSIAVAVVRDDEVVWATGVGWADIEQGIHADRSTVYQLASVSKTVTCGGIMTLVEDGVLDLDADINGYLPFEVHVPDAPGAAITLRHLLTHASAIRDRWQVWGSPWSDPTLYFHGDSPLSLGDFCASYFAVSGAEYRPRRNFYDRAPGTKYAYSNLATALAGYVAESASGIDFNELCKDRILHPIGITNAGFRLADIDTTNIAMPYSVRSDGFEPIFHYGYPDYPDGALRSSAPHLARWLGAFMNLGAFRGTRILEEATVKEMRRSQVPDLVYWGQGLIWYAEHTWGFRMLGHTGGDYGETTRMFYRPDRRIGVVSLTNSYLGGARWDAFSGIERRLFHTFA